MDRFQQIIELSAECIKEISPDGTVIAVNGNGVRLLRAASPDEVVGKSWLSLWPEQARPLVEGAMEAARRGDRAEFEAACPDFMGDHREWCVRVSPLVEDGRLTLLAVSTDVTARNRAVHAAEFLQTTLSDHLEDSRRRQSEFSEREAGLARTLATAESRLVARNLAYQQLQAMHHEATEGRRFALAAQRAAELIAEQAQKGEAVGQLLAGVVHDLNNFLQSAVSALDLVSASGELGERSARYLAIAEASLQQGVEMSGRLIGFARQHPYQPEPVDLSEMVAAMTPLLMQAVGSKADLRIDTCGTACCAMVDRNTIERALLNLVINARDACRPDDRITISTGALRIGSEQATATRAEGDYLTLTVSDTGLGMSEAVQARLFDVYFTTKPVGEGSGLGLPQVLSAVRQAGGFVTVTSRPGEGARFELALPKVEAD